MEIQMAITPQAIKDQEFVVKFRGYDAIEVKAYLEMIAEEFFELFEQVRQQNEEIEGLIEENQDHVDRHASFEKDINALMDKNDRLTEELARSNERNAALDREIDDLKEKISDLEQEKEEKEMELAAANEQIAAEKELVESEKKEKEDIGERLAEVEQKWAEQKNVEIDFKETLLAAQKFSRDMRKSSEDEARHILEKARSDAEKLRQETFQELARYPKEIERLKMKRNQVREDLRTVLSICIENLDVFKNDEKDEEDFSDLFQSMVVSDDGMVNHEELAKLDMELDLLESIHAEEESVSAEGKDADAGDGL
jgi:cell division initiation protein